MDFLERALDEKKGDVLMRLTEGMGFTSDEAERFLREAGPALIQSYEWQSDQIAPSTLGTDESVRALLGGIRGNALADRIGLSHQQTWDALRVFVPVVAGPSGVGRGRSVEQDPIAGARSADHGPGDVLARRSWIGAGNPILGRLPFFRPFRSV